MWLIILPHDYLLFIIFGSEHRSPWGGAFNCVCTLTFVIGVPHNLSTKIREKRKK